MHVLFYYVLALCSLFYSMALLSLRIVVLCILPNPSCRLMSIYLFHLLIHLFIYISSTEPIGSSVMGGHVAWCWGLVAALLVGQASQVF